MLAEIEHVAVGDRRADMHQIVGSDGAFLGINVGLFRRQSGFEDAQVLLVAVSLIRPLAILGAAAANPVRRTSPVYSLSQGPSMGRPARSLLRMAPSRRRLRRLRWQCP